MGWSRYTKIQLALSQLTFHSAASSRGSALFSQIQGRCQFLSVILCLYLSETENSFCAPKDASQPEYQMSGKQATYQETPASS